MGIEIRNITEDEVTDFRRVLNNTFGGDIDEKDEEEKRHQFLEQIDLTRTYVPFDGPEMVGTAAALTFDISLPGGTTTGIGGLTMVTVRPTHRRRGLLRRLIQAHFEDCMARGEALSGLWASESSIYGRFGYGDAAPVADIKLDGSKIGVLLVMDEVRFVDLDTARKLAAKNRKLVADQKNPRRLENYHDLMGLIALKAKDYDKAIEHYGQANPNNMYSKYHLALAYESAGRMSEARELFREVANWNFNSVGYALVRKDAIAKSS